MTRSEIFKAAWLNVKQNGVSLSVALKAAWAASKAPKTTFTFNTKGASPVYPATSIELSIKKIANYIQENINGFPASQVRVNAMTQDFINKHEIIAIYSSGTLMGFEVSDAAYNEFMKLPR